VDRFFHEYYELTLVGHGEWEFRRANRPRAAAVRYSGLPVLVVDHRAQASRP